MASGADGSQADPNQADRHKHLEFIQAIIARLASNSFLMKGWALTLSTAVFGYAVAQSSGWVAAIGTLPPLGFWFLDSYYLRQERMFRCLSRDVAKGVVRDFVINVKPYEREVGWPRTAVSVSLTGFYGLLLTVATALVIVTGSTQLADHPEPGPLPPRSTAP